MSDNELYNIKNDIINNINNSYYYKLNNISGNLLLKYIFYFLIIYKSTTIIKIDIQIIFALIISSIIIFIIYDKDQIYKIAGNKDIEFKLNSIYPKPLYFKNQNNLIDFVYSIKDYRTYNYDSFDKMLKCIDNILRIHNDVKIDSLYCNLNLDVAKDNMNNSINYLHSIIYKLPANHYVENRNYIAIDRLYNILNEYIQEIINICNNKIKQNGFNSSSKWVYSNDIDGLDLASKHDLNHFKFV